MAFDRPGRVRPAMTGTAGARLARVRRFCATLGPGLLVMIADSDPGNVATAAQCGGVWGYRLLPLLLLLIPPLYFVQELAVRLGVFSGRGFGELVRQEFGLRWAAPCAAALVLAALGTLVTAFAAVAGIGEVHGLSRPVSLAGAAALLAVARIGGSYRRIERVALAIGAFEAAFFVVAWQARPDVALIMREAADVPLRSPQFGYLAAAVVGASFSPWMTFYQQSAIVARGIGPADYRAARWDTAAGAALTQCLTAAVLIAAATTLRDSGPLASLGDIVEAFSNAEPHISPFVFDMGVLGAALVAVIVASLALTWGLGEIFGGSARDLSGGGWVSAAFAVTVCGSAVLVGFTPDLVSLTVAAQAANVILSPVVVTLLIILAGRVLPERLRLRGRERAIVVASAATTMAIGVAGGLLALFS
ncbi:NRAMP family divalent metal transporter [Methylocella sp.]|uniref:NRAMP family divalent metal transporter n=1 Tax=Methylocella sp. TaxID=1978226 RepID=UPI003783BC59